MNAFDLDETYAMTTYRRQPICFVRGSGTRLWDSQGKEYIDFLGGIAVCSLGHAHPAVTEAIQRQAASLLHTSNLFHNENQPALAERLCKLSGMERAFFCNSGTEAVECALKIARKWGRLKGIQNPEIVSLEGGFHGRTFGSLSATPTPAYQAPFQPLVPGFVAVPRNDLAALSAAITDRTCAVILEAIQGESGVHELDAAYLQGVRALCDERGMLLIADEIQCGLWRTGTFLAIEQAGVKPDVATLAKGLANGVPIGVCLASGPAAKVLEPGDHGSTFGGGPLACAAALAVLKAIEDEGLAENAAQTGAFLIGLLKEIEGVAETRGKGLMIGVGLKAPHAKQALSALLAKGFVANAVGDGALRLLPPLLIARQECAQLAEALAAALKSLETAPKEILV